MYDAVDVIPIAQALLTIDTNGDPQVAGAGFATVSRGPGFGNFMLTLDMGTAVGDFGSGSPAIINGQAVQGGYSHREVGPNGLDPRFARAMVTVRGGTTAPGTTTLTSQSTEFVAGPPGSGSLVLQIVTRDVTDAAIDPMGAGVPNAAGSGIEIMVWSFATPDNVTIQQFGPLFQSSMQFP